MKKLDVDLQCCFHFVPGKKKKIFDCFCLMWQNLKFKAHKITALDCWVSESIRKVKSLEVDQCLACKSKNPFTPLCLCYPGKVSQEMASAVEKNNIWLISCWIDALIMLRQRTQRRVGLQQTRPTEANTTTSAQVLHHFSSMEHTFLNTHRNVSCISMIIIFHKQPQH